MLKILVIDHHELIRAGLRRLLEGSLGPVHISEARNADEARQLFSQHEWSLVITDITLPGPGGLEVLAEFRKLRPQTPVLVISILAEDEVALRVLKAGAAGFASKDTSGAELVNAVRRILDGGKYVSPALAEKLVTRMVAPAPEEPHKRLSDREYLVMRMLASGQTLTEIGRLLSLSIKTISTYRSRVLQKLQLANNAELTRYALKHRLVE